MTSKRELLRKREWTVSDFAEYSGLSHGQAKRRLKRLDVAHGGKLLRRSGGNVNREFTFLPATLARLEPDYFETIESLELRIEELEDDVSEVKALQRRLAHQTGSNTKRIEQLSLFRKTG